MRKILWIIVLISSLWGCREKPGNIFKQDETLRSVYDAALTRDTLALAAFLNHENEKYRSRAAFLFHTMYTPEIREKLEALLRDSSWAVRQGAAYSLGQFARKESLPALQEGIERETQPKARAAMLEAYGKCGDVRHLKYLTAVELKTEEEIRGWAYGMYRLGVFSANAISRSIKLFAKSKSPKTKRAISFYLGDTRTADYRSVIPYEMEIKALINECDDPVTKSYLLTSLQALPLKRKSDFLLALLPEARNDLLRFRCLEQLCFTPSGIFLKDIARHYLADSSLHIRLNIMNWLAVTADSSDRSFFREGLEKEQNEHLLVYLFKGWLQSENASEASCQSLLAAARNFKNPQARADLYALLTKYADRYAPQLLRAAYMDQEPVVAYRILDGMRSHYKTHPVPDSVRQHVAGYSVFMIRSGRDPLMVYGAELLADTNIRAYEWIDESDWLEELLQEALKPRVEYAFMHAIKAIKGLATDEREYYLAPPARPDWKEISDLPDSFFILFHCRQGDVKMKMYTEAAPMSVWRFWDLCRSGYYDSSVVHRVVYPHVIQGGSQFGDGYNDDLAPIRTETGFLHFDAAGMVGFASDGRDTETGQWFITHLPRPHLDPNYTIFAKVVEGMDVVNEIYKGDLILSTEIQEH